jgi:hypothetical protein
MFQVAHMLLVVAKLMLMEQLVKQEVDMKVCPGRFFLIAIQGMF